MKKKPLKLALGLLFGILSLSLMQGCSHSNSSNEPSRRMEPTYVDGGQGLFSITKKLVSKDAEGGKYNCEISILPLADVGNVRVQERFPSELNYVSSNPSGKLDGNSVMWGYDCLKKGEEKIIQVTYAPTVDGEFTACTIVSGDPKVCLPIAVGIAKLDVIKSGPSDIRPGEVATWDITVKNVGSDVAKSVMVKDNLPQGFTPMSSTSQNLGDIKPGESKTCKVAAKSSQEGSFVNAVEVISDSISKVVTASTPFDVTEANVSIAEVGPAEAYIGAPANYEITVQNTGKTRLENVVVTDTMPEFSKLIEAGGGSVNGNDVVWKVGGLNPGESKTMNLRFTRNSPGIAVNKAAVVADKNLMDEAQVNTKWLPSPGITASISDSKDPIAIGDITILTGEIKNQSLDTVKLSAVITISDGLEVVDLNANADYKRDGNKITLSNLVINPTKSVVVKIKTKGVKRGVGTSVLEVKADFLPEINVNEEPTTVY